MAYRNNNIEFDSEKLIESADKIIELVVQYETKINTMFGRLKFNNNQEPWFGDNAKLYADIAAETKKDYLDYGDGIKKIAKEMKEFAMDLDGQIRENEDNCENGTDEYVSYY